MFDLDDRIRSRILGYKGAHSCWRSVSCITAIPEISIPLLALIAKDDPITKYIHYPIDDLKRNKNIMVAVT